MVSCAFYNGNSWKIDDLSNSTTLSEQGFHLCNSLCWKSKLTAHFENDRVTQRAIGELHRVNEEVVISAGDEIVPGELPSCVITTYADSIDAYSMYLKWQSSRVYDVSGFFPPRDEQPPNLLSKAIVSNFLVKFRMTSTPDLVRWYNVICDIGSEIRRLHIQGFPLKDENLRGILDHIGHHSGGRIESLSIDDVLLPDWILRVPTWREIRRVKLHNFDGPFFHNSRIQEDIKDKRVTLVEEMIATQQWDKLEHISIYQQGFMGNGMFRRFCRANPQLKSLSTYAGLPGVIFDGIEECLPNLEKYTLRMNIAWLDIKKLVFLEKLAHLKQLKLSYLCEFEVPKIINLASKLKSLTHLKLHTYDDSESFEDHHVTTLATDLAHLKVFYLEMQDCPRERYVEMVRLMPNLDELGVPLESADLQFLETLNNARMESTNGDKSRPLTLLNNPFGFYRPKIRKSVQTLEFLKVWSFAAGNRILRFKF